jgi:glycosyltransferase involved in cell wall biosynthesis
VNILHLGKFFPPAKGGMETVLALLCEGTSRAVRNRAIVANQAFGTVYERIGHTDVVRVGTVMKSGAVAVCPAMPLHLSREAADAIVIHEPNPMGLIAYYIARPRAPLIVWFHSEVIRPTWQYRLFYEPILDFALERATRIVVASPTLAASAPALERWRSKCVVIPYGVSSAADEVNRPADLPSHSRRRPLVLFVGRLVAYKGAHVLLEAVRGLDVDVVLVGDGPLRAKLERTARDLGVDDRVTFAGEVGTDALRAFYRACDLFVLPSVTRQEAFGMVQIEAMACGKPVISTDLGTGVSWVNQHRETGLVVPPEDAKALRDAIETLAGDTAVRAAFGEAARRRAKSVFHADRMIEATLNLYGEVVHQRVSDVA